MRAAFLVALLALSGCLRVGPGDDLYLVCEEKSGSPRMAYGVDDLLFVLGMPNATGEERAMLDAARRHLVTPGGAPHEELNATLAREGADAARFDATGRLGEHLDEYAVDLAREGAGWSARTRGPSLPEPVRAPASLAEPARRAVENSSDALAHVRNATFTGAGWDPALPSCVFAHYGDRVVVVNVRQDRVVDLS